jgi:hypothetical protein
MTTQRGRSTGGGMILWAFECNKERLVSTYTVCM